MIIPEILEKSRRSFPDKTAVISQNRRVTYSELGRMVHQLAHALIQEGVNKGDRVAVLLRNTYEAVVAYFAILKIGAIEVAFNPISDGPRSLSYKFTDCEPKILITSPAHVHLISGILPEVPFVKAVYLTEEPERNNLLDKRYVVLQEIFSAGIKPKIKVTIHNYDLAIIAYTAGTTGSPKGVMLTHENLLVTAQSMRRGGRTLSLIPLFHVYGKGILNNRISNGDTIIFVENFIFSADIFEIIRNEKVEGIIGVPTIMDNLISSVAKEKASEWDYIRYFSTGGSKMPVAIFLRLWDVFPKAEILSGYGLTETGGSGTIRVFSERTVDIQNLHSVGKPGSSIELKIVNESGQSVGSGEIGEVVFGGPQVMQGYWNKPKETNEVLKDGWLYTGDIGKTDKEGNLFLIDRKKDIIKSGGELISPKEIESIIETHPDVKESAVIGIEDHFMGEKLKAFVVLKPQKMISEDEILRFCSQHLPPIKIPSMIEFRDSLPKSTLDKIKKHELRETPA